MVVENENTINILKNPVTVDYIKRVKLSESLINMNIFVNMKSIC